MLHQTTFLTIYILMITFILGCALGSFTDCLAGRMLNGTSVLKGRSHCDACGHVLGVLDLVPLFSRLCLRAGAVIAERRSRRRHSGRNLFQELHAA